MEVFPRGQVGGVDGISHPVDGQGQGIHHRGEEKLILVLRETPYSLITIRNMEQVTLAGAVVLPASPGFYGKPKKVDDLVDFIVARVLDQIGLKHELGTRWRG